MSTYRLSYASAPSTYIDLDGTPDANNSRWYLTKLEGWHEPPPVKVGVLPKVFAHGSVRLPAYYDARTIVIGGVCRATSRANAKTSKAVLRAYYATASLSSGVVFKETEGSDTLQATFYTPEGATCRIDHPVNSTSFEWELTLIATSPYKTDQAAAIHI